MRAVVTVNLKTGVLDPQGEAIRAALGSMGFDGVQGVRQGNDRGTQYRSGIYTYSDAQAAAAWASPLRTVSSASRSSYRPSRGSTR